MPSPLNPSASAEGAQWREAALQALTKPEGAGEVAAWLRQLPRQPLSPADFASLGRAIAGLGEAGARAAGLRPLRTFIVRSVTVEPWLPHLIVWGAQAGLWLDVTVGGYGSFIDELMNPEGALGRARPELVLALIDMEDLGGQLPEICSRAQEGEIRQETERIASDLDNLLSGLRRHSRARLLVQGWVVPDRPALGEVAEANSPAGEGWAVGQINAAAAASCRRLGDAIFFDQDRVAARAGRDDWRDERMFRFSRLAVAAPRFSEYARALARHLRALYAPPRKVLCTDLDNTLWGGVVGEDHPEGIATGAAFPGNCYREYQRCLKQLAARGILLAIASKNNPADVEEAFRARAADLSLRLEDFAAVQIGWHDKADSLAAIAQELSLGLDAFVFVDDEPAECEAIRRRLPEVLVVQAPRNEPWRLTDMIRSLEAFDALAITEEDRQRGQEYKSQAQRADLESRAGSREEFLASLEIVCELLPAGDAPMSRAVQLTNKTNQFNLTTRRYAAADIEGFAAAPGGIAVALRYRDRFGDAGVIGLALVRRDGRRAIIDTFLLSCRVIGRGVESALLWHLAQQARSQGATVLAGEYVPTAKNQPCQDFYDRHGFRRLDSGDNSQTGAVGYEFDLTAGMPEKPAWVRLVPHAALAAAR